MNPLTQIKNTQKITAREAAAGLSEEASWHHKYKDSAYVYVGGLSFDLTEGDLLAVFAQYGEVVDVNLVRDKATGKSKGFAFLAYEDQRSTILAVDNLNGARVAARMIKVDHVANYKRKKEEDEEEAGKKREAAGVCYAFQRGECNRGDSCKFSHDEQRNANTGWGRREDLEPEGGGPARRPPFRAPAPKRERERESPPPSRDGFPVSKKKEVPGRGEEGTRSSRAPQEEQGRGSKEEEGGGAPAGKGLAAGGGANPWESSLFSIMSSSLGTRKDSKRVVAVGAGAGPSGNEEGVKREAGASLGSGKDSKRAVGHSGKEAGVKQEEGEPGGRKKRADGGKGEVEGGREQQQARADGAARAPHQNGQAARLSPGRGVRRVSELEGRSHRKVHGYERETSARRHGDEGVAHGGSLERARDRDRSDGRALESRGDGRERDRRRGDFGNEREQRRRSRSPDKDGSRHQASREDGRESRRR
eukprot:jgi/Mesen1/3599/ME000020S03128